VLNTHFAPITRTLNKKVEIYYWQLFVLIFIVAAAIQSHAKVKLIWPINCLMLADDQSKEHRFIKT
jgi:hypothetical protein